MSSQVLNKKPLITVNQFIFASDLFFAIAIFSRERENRETKSHIDIRYMYINL